MTVEPFILLFVCPVVVVLGVYWVTVSKNATTRFFAATSIVCAAVVVGYVVASGFLMNHVLDLCGDETSSYFKEHRAFHPNCEKWEKYGY